MNLNKVVLVGRLTRDPESKSLPSGSAVTTFGMATSRFFYDKAGQKQQQTEFHNIVIFGKLADIASQYLNKGSLVLIEGRLQTRTWKDNSGNQRSRTEIIAQSLQLGPKSASSASRETTPQNKKPAEAAKEEIPIIEEGGGEIDVSSIPF